MGCSAASRRPPGVALRPGPARPRGRPPRSGCPGRSARRVGASLLGTYTGEKLVRGFRAVLFRHAQRLSLAYHDTKGTSRLDLPHPVRRPVRPVGRGRRGHPARHLGVHPGRDGRRHHPARLAAGPGRPGGGPGPVPAVPRLRAAAQAAGQGGQEDREPGPVGGPGGAVGHPGGQGVRPGGSGARAVRRPIDRRDAGPAAGRPAVRVCSGCWSG